MPPGNYSFNFEPALLYGITGGMSIKCKRLSLLPMHFFFFVTLSPQGEESKKIIVILLDEHTSCKPDARLSLSS